MKAPILMLQLVNVELTLLLYLLQSSLSQSLFVVYILY